MDFLSANGIRTGPKWGLWMGILLCVWVAVLIPINGGLIFRSRHGVELHAFTIMLLYLVGGLTTGALFGSTIELLRWKTAAFIIGAAAMIPIGAALALTKNTFEGWGRHDTLTVLTFALVFGGPGGLIIREFVLRGKRKGR